MILLNDKWYPKRYQQAKQVPLAGIPMSLSDTRVKNLRPAIISARELIDMTKAQIAERKNLYRRIRSLPDSRVAQVVELVDSLEEYEPNEETIKILKDSQEGRNVIGPFRNMNDFMASLLSDNDA